jgi:D-glycero-beta-D-manno-heptose-7-phosphate kinase
MTRLPTIPYHPPDKNRLLALIDRFSGINATIIGDVILDEYLIGRATRMSREAPVPVLEFEQRRVIAGGAANPAVNVAALGGRAALVGVVGNDPEGATLKETLAKSGVEPRLVIDAKRQTTVKTRIMAAMGLRFPQQVARIDKVSREPVSPAALATAQSLMEVAAEDDHVLLYSNYNLGFVTRKLADMGRKLSRQTGQLLVADTQGAFEPFAGFDAVKCNAEEASAHLAPDHELPPDADDYAEAAHNIKAKFGLKRALVITRGGEGAVLADADALHHCPAPQVTDVYDTVGAGDTAVAVIALALAAGGTSLEAVTLANFASGIVIRHVGNFAPSAAMLREAIIEDDDDFFTRAW